MRVSGPACIGLALALLLLPMRWIAAMIFAAAVHETGHLLAIWLCGGRVFAADLALGGAKMELSPLPPGKILVCALAGPAAGLFLVPLVRHFPRLALCALVQSAYNLLPLGPLDGGRALEAAAELLCPARSARISRRAHRVTLCLLALIAAWAGFSARIGPLPLLAAGIVCLKNRSDLCRSGHFLALLL